MSTTVHAPADTHAHGKGHGVNLMVCFLALLGLTAGEVVLYEIWRHTAAEGNPFVPKFAIVLLILVLTFPKAAIVLIYFMHLKFEKQFVVMLAVIPLLLTFLAVLPTMIDALVLKDRAYNKVESIGHYKPAHAEHAEAHGETGHDVPQAAPAVQDETH